MSTKEQKVITKTCDVCQNPVKEFVEAGEFNGEVIISMKKSLWYCTDENWDVCPKCSKEIIKLVGEIRKNNIF